MSETIIQPRVPTPDGTEYYYWYDGDILIKSELLDAGVSITPTEDQFPTLYKDGYDFIGWYFFNDVNKSQKIYVTIGTPFTTETYFNEFHSEWKRTISKVTFYGQTLMDLTEDTITENNIFYGIIGHSKSGSKIKGAVTDAREAKF